MWMIYSMCVNFVVIIENIKVVKNSKWLLQFVPGDVCNVIYSKISEDDKFVIEGERQIAALEL